MKFQEFLIFDPRVSLISAENSELGFLQLFEGDIQLTSVIISFKGLFLEVISPTKPISSSLA
jgi:hypothetical protein